jgi:uncharacterized repeat protein (TIGR03803 family)
MSRQRSQLISFVLVLALLPVLESIGAAQVFTTLFVFNNGDGGTPNLTILAQGRDGQLYGATQLGGVHGYGTIFRLSTEGTETVLHSFDKTDGESPVGGLTLASDGNFYGTANAGGTYDAGVLFSISTSGKYTILYNFTGSSDAYPDGPPLESLDGNMYGTAQGADSWGGEVYQYERAAGTFTVIHDFTNTGFTTPVSPVIRATNGTLWGTVNEGGSYGYGAAFQMTPAGVVEDTFSFNADTTGGYPEWPLIQASNGNFYGVTSGSLFGGSVLQITPGGHLSIFYHQPIGSAPLNDTTSGLVQGTDGNLYGLALSGGAHSEGGIYQLTLAGVYADVYDFTGDQMPSAAMVQHTNGSFYGTFSRSALDGYGGIYSFDMGLGPFVAIVRPNGQVGQTAQILGQGLTNSSSVTFNGLAAASFKVVSDTYMNAVVPGCAATGRVVVTTPNGSLTSNHNFQIVQ